MFLFKELNDETGNPIWKNRVESWKDKKNVKKATKKAEMAQIPVEQQMEEKEYGHRVLSEIDFFSFR